MLLSPWYPWYHGDRETYVLGFPVVPGFFSFKNSQIAPGFFSFKNSQIPFENIQIGDDHDSPKMYSMFLTRRYKRVHTKMVSRVF